MTYYQLPMIRILLVDDQKILCEMMQSWLEQERDLQVVGNASDGESAIAFVETLQPDIVLLDIEMPGMDGITATDIISGRFPKTKVIVLSGYDDDAYLTNALRAGAKGYLLKNTQATELANTIRSVHKGYSQVSPGLLEKITAKMSSDDDSKAESASLEWLDIDLPEPEFRLLLEGFDIQALSEAAQRLTLKKTASNLFTRLSLHLKQKPDNPAALYLAGVLAHRVQGQPPLAFQYLRYGFREAIKQGLSRESLLLFYREGAILKSVEAFYWLIQVDSPFNNEEGMSFLLQEAAQVFGFESIPYQIVLALGQIRSLRQFSNSCTSVGDKVENLKQGFQRLGKAIKTL
jgi:DNA-binding NarL/FixJ family response regulator